MRDLLSATAELVDIASVSNDEQRLADLVEVRLRGVPWLQVTRVGDNLVARTDFGRDARLGIVGHLDTVPAQDNEHARLLGDKCFGLGACDMKGGLAVFLDLAETVAEPALDLTYVFYAAEEVAAVHNGLRALFAKRPDLLDMDAAIIGEPTAAAVEAGCQGTMRARITMAGRRAHTARPWMGENAIHRLGGILDRIATYEPREPVIEGCRFREALQAVAISGGSGTNVVPDEAAVVVNHRFAPDRTPAEAERWLREFLAPFDDFELTDLAPAAPPAGGHPILAPLAGRHGLEVRAKLGWTDVARFAEHGIPAVNFGPGDPTIAHTAGEFVTRHDLETVHEILRDLVTTRH